MVADDLPALAPGAAGDRRPGAAGLPRRPLAASAAQYRRRRVAVLTAVVLPLTAVAALVVMRPAPAGPSAAKTVAAAPPPPRPTAAAPTPTATATAAAVPPDDTFAPVEETLVDVPVQRQLPELPNGCEVTSLSMLLDAAGISVDKLTLADAQENDPTPPVYRAGSRDFYEILRWGNPNVSFVGSVRGSGGLGIYHAPLARLADRQAPGRVRDLTGSGFAAVLDQVRRGNPVLAWTTVSKTPVTRWVTWQTPQGPFTATRQEHAVLIVGYNAHGLLINNPLSGRRETVPARPFLTSWQQLGRQALVLRPVRQRPDRP